MNWGKCDFGELKRLEEKIKKFEEVDFDETCRKAAEKLGLRFRLSVNGQILL